MEERKSLVLEETEEDLHILKPKGYQLRVFEHAITQNTIAFLETGTGKTYIAILVIKHIFNEPLQVNRRNISLKYTPTIPKPAHKVFFVVRTISLLYQQAYQIEQLTRLKVGAYHSESEVSFSSYSEWRKELDRHEVFVIIADILLELLRHGIMKIEEIDFLIFDECHHTDKMNSYNLIMREFYFHKLVSLHENKRPKILGLTASPFKTKFKSGNEKQLVLEARKKFKELCNNLNCAFCPLEPEIIKEIKGRHEIIYLPFSPNMTQEKTGELILEKIISAIVQQMRLPSPTHYEKFTMELKTQYKMYSESPNTANEYLSTRRKGNLGNSLTKKSYNASLYLFTKLIICKSSTIISELGITGLYLFFLDVSADIEAKMREKGDVQPFDKLLGIFIKISQLLGSEGWNKPSSKLEALVGILGKGNLENRVIIFVKERFIAHYLNKCLSRYNNLYQTQVIMGHSNSSRSSFSISEEGVERHPWLPVLSHIVKSLGEQKETIAQFREGLFNILIGTDVVEEGFDIPECNMVCVFNMLTTIKSFIQMQGRARDAHSKFIIMTRDMDRRKVEEQIDQFEIMIRITKDLTESESDRIKPDKNILSKFKYPRDEYEEIESTGAKVCSHFAVKLLSIWVASLPMSEYSYNSLKWEEQQIPGPKYRYILLLPPSLPKQLQIIEDKETANYYNAKQDAKNRVAFIACQILIANNKLNKYLYSTSKHGDHIQNSILFSNSTLGGVVTLKIGGEYSIFNEESTVHFGDSAPEVDIIGTTSEPSKSHNSHKNADNSNIFPSPFPMITPMWSKQCKFTLYQFDLFPQYPFLNTGKTLGIIAPKSTLPRNKILIYIDNSRIYKMYNALNIRSKLLNESPPLNYIFSNPTYTRRIRNLEVEVSFNKVAEISLTLPEFLKLKYFHKYSFYVQYAAEFSILKRLLCGKEDFGILFEEELKKANPDYELENKLKEGADKGEFVSYPMLIPLLTESENIDKQYKNNPEIDWETVNKSIEEMVGKVKGKFRQKDNININNINSGVEGTLGNIIETDYNKCKYIVLSSTKKTPKTNIMWSSSRLQRKIKINFANYYLERYKISIPEETPIVKCKQLGTFINSIQEFSNTLKLKTIRCIDRKEMEEGVEETAGQIDQRKMENKFEKELFLPLSVCRRVDYPLDLCILFKHMPSILTQMNNIYSFTHFQHVFFSGINVYKCETNPNHLNYNIPKTHKEESMEDLMRLEYIAEAMTASSAGEAYNYERLEFLGDAILKLLVSFELYAIYPEYDAGELDTNKLGKVGNKYLFQIAYQQSLHTYLKVKKDRNMQHFVPPGMSRLEYSSIFLLTKNVAHNSWKYQNLRHRPEEPFMDIVLEENVSRKQKQLKEKMEKYSRGGEDLIGKLVGYGGEEAKVGGVGGMDIDMGGMDIDMGGMDIDMGGMDIDTETNTNRKEMETKRDLTQGDIREYILEVGRGNPCNVEDKELDRMQRSGGINMGNASNMENSQEIEEGGSSHTDCVHIGYEVDGEEDSMEGGNVENITDITDNISENISENKTEEENPSNKDTNKDMNIEYGGESITVVPYENIESSEMRDIILEEEEREIEEIRGGDNINDPNSPNEQRESLKEYKVSEKQIADIIESLTGAVYKCIGLQGCQCLLRYFNILDNTYSQSIPYPLQQPPRPVSITQSLMHIENILMRGKYHFTSPWLLEEALTHSAYLDSQHPYYIHGIQNIGNVGNIGSIGNVGSIGSIENIENIYSEEDTTQYNYQRLEFLGDAVLDFLCSRYLYERESNADPCLLHKMKICCVNNQLLGVIALQYGIQNYLITPNYSINRKIDRYLEEYEGLLRITSKGGILNLDSLDDYFVKIVPDLFESIIGALLVDSGGDVDLVWKIFGGVLAEYWDLYGSLNGFREHPKCLFQEMIQEHASSTIRDIRVRKRNVLTREGRYVVEFKGYMGGEIVTRSVLPNGSRIYEKKFFTQYYKDAKIIVEEYDYRALNGFKETYMSIDTICREKGLGKYNSKTFEYAHYA